MNPQNEISSTQHASASSRLVDRVAVVTGAASGIGKEIALAFAREGARVVIADLDQKAAQQTASEIDQVAQRALGVAMDVSNEEQVGAGMAHVIQTFGRLDILVSNWIGAFLTTRAALRQMYSQKSGNIIYMGSVHSKEASPLKAPYVTAEHGLVGLAKVVAKEGAAHGVRANVIGPGFVRTPLVEKQNPGAGARARDIRDGCDQDGDAKETMDGEFTTVREVAEIAVFLAAFPSDALTGQSVVVSHWMVHAVAASEKRVLNRPSRPISAAAGSLHRSPCILALHNCAILILTI